MSRWTTRNSTRPRKRALWVEADESIAAPMHCLDHGLTDAVVAEDAPRGLDPRRECGLGDKSSVTRQLVGTGL